MSRSITIAAIGVPQPQGSTRAWVRGGRAVVTSANKNLRPWRDTVTSAAIEAMGESRWTTTTGPVAVRLDIWLTRPTSHYNRAGSLLPSAPASPAKRPDIDKLVRSTFDSLTDAGVWRDDGQVVFMTVSKAYAAEDDRAGVRVRIVELGATVGERSEEAAA